jgi:DNA-binding CsgD family transcriptional regulator
MRLALGESDDHEIATPHGSETGPLARREVEVAQLVAEGLSNKQVAARLLISERTVATHVGHILDKLGFKSRAQIAGWISSDRQALQALGGQRTRLTGSTAAAPMMARAPANAYSRTVSIDGKAAPGGQACTGRPALS